MAKSGLESSSSKRLLDMRSCFELAAFSVGAPRLIELQKLETAVLHLDILFPLASYSRVVLETAVNTSTFFFVELEETGNVSSLRCTDSTNILFQRGPTQR